MVKMSQRLVSATVAKTRIIGIANKKLYITIHETANTGKGANADAHARLQSNGNNRPASWHWQVDDKEAIQSFSHETSCMHAGDGGKGTGNLNSIGIEICVNSDGDFKKAVQNAAELTRHIMRLENIPNQNVVQHNEWSGKDCPTLLRKGTKGIKWADFIGMIRETAVVKTSAIVEEGTRMFKPSSATLKNGVINYLEQAATDKIVEGKWAEQAKESKLTLDDAFALSLIIESRRKTK